MTDDSTRHNSRGKANDPKGIREELAEGLARDAKRLSTTNPELAEALRAIDPEQIAVSLLPDDPQSVSQQPKAERKPRTKQAGVLTPKKPHKDFPLSIHKGTGYWCKKVKGRVHYFGKVADDPKGKAALEQWLEQKDDLLAGREPRAKKDDELAVGDLCNQFLAHKEQLRDNGELSPRTFQTYYATCATVVKQFGRNRAVTDLTPADFRKLRAKLAKTRGVVALRNEMQRVRSIFKFAFDDGLILAPVRFGQGFAKPKLDTVRRAREAHRNEHGDRMFEAHEIREILATAKQPIKAMVLLAANCAFGQSDLSNLPTRAVDLDAGWLDFARVKTAVPRRVPLWPETIAEIREWLPQRPKAKDPADTGLLFLTRRGQRWVKLNKSGSPADALGQEFAKVLRVLGLKRPGVSFYALRHTFETIAGESQDQVAVNAVMGHVDTTMASAYRERVSDDRLRAVVETVRWWLFADAPDKTTVPDKLGPRISDPSDPSDPSSNFSEASKSSRGSHVGLQINLGSHGAQGSQNSEPHFENEDDRPSLSLFVG